MNKRRGGKQATARLSLGDKVRLVVFALLAAAPIVALIATGGPYIDFPDEREAQRLTAALALASDERGVCFGWELIDGNREDGHEEKSAAGSNLGAGVSVADQPVRCLRWMTIRAKVTRGNGKPSSERYKDRAELRVETSAHFSRVVVRDGLERLGIRPQAFIDDADDAITRAALALPELVTTATVPSQ